MSTAKIFNKSKIILAHSFLLVFLCSCTKVPERNNKIFGALGDLDVLDLYKHTAVLIMPATGCTGCISSTELFVKDKKFPQLLLILTNIVSRKDAEFRLGLVDPQCDYYYDAAKAFYLEDDSKATYPAIVYLDKGSLKKSKIEFVEPHNPDALFNLESFLYDNNP